VKKGRLIYVEGRLKYGTYTDKTTGVEKNTVDIIATSCSYWAAEKAWAAPPDDGGSRAPARSAAPAASATRAPAPAKFGFLTTWTTIFPFNQGFPQQTVLHCFGHVHGVYLLCLRQICDGLCQSQHPVCGPGRPSALISRLGKQLLGQWLQAQSLQLCLG
jgi:hypothetical protein